MSQISSHPITCGRWRSTFCTCGIDAQEDHALEEYKPTEMTSLREIKGRLQRIEYNQAKLLAAIHDMRDFLNLEIPRCINTNIQQLRTETVCSIGNAFLNFEKKVKKSKPQPKRKGRKA